MDLLSLTQFQTKHSVFVTEKTSDRLFFDQYQYCLCIKMFKVSVLRHVINHEIQLNDDDANNKVDQVLSWHMSRLKNYGGNWGTHDLSRDAVKLHLNNLHLVRKILIDNRRSLKVTFSTDWAYVYSNDLDIFSKILSLDFVTFVSFKECIVNRPKNTILNTNPEFKHRTYLKDKWITSENRERIVNCLLAQGTDIKMSKSLTKWANPPEEKHRRFSTVMIHQIQRHYFFEHNNPGISTVLELSLPGIIRKTISIIAK